MDFRFWRKNSAVPDDVLAWNVMVAVTDPDRCWQIASAFRQTKVPGSVLTCEMSFLMGSLVREAIRTAFTGDRRRAAITSAESAYFKTFDDQSSEDLPDDMKAVYGDIRLGQVARAALAAYAEHDDMLFLTSSEFVHRIMGDPRMKFEIMPILERCRDSVLKALKK
jgi:hypothetical protein